MGILTRRNIRKAKGLYPRPPCDCREVFSCGEGLPRQAVTQPTDKRHSRPSGASSVVKGENEIRACSPDRVFVMKNRTFVEFISKIRAAWLFLHIANKKLVPMRIKSRTSGLMQTPREISHTGNPTGGAEAHPAVLPAAHEATDNPDNIFYRTIRTAMKKQLIYLLASACLLAAGCSTENKTDETGYGTLAINCTADTSIDTASAEASGTPEAPAAGAFSLTVTGETGTQKWDTLTEFEQSQTVFRMGAYTVAIAHGNPDAEGAGKPYYYAEQKIEVVPRRTVNADLTATVANSQVVIRATEQFLAYFHDARFTVTTASGNEFAFTPGSDPADEPVFVKGGTRLTVTGCVNEEPPYKEDPNPEPAGMTGYLSIGNLSMTVVYDETEIRPDDTSDETQAARTASGTRATAPDVDSFIVEILDADNAQVLEMTYAELKEQLKTPMELKVGVYRMEVRSEDTMPGADWEHPVYGATSDFTITKAQTTSPEEVVCTLQNIKVSVEYSPELADMLADTSKATVSLGDTSLDFSKTETRAAYFKPLALENTLNFAFDGTFADTGVPAKFSKQITGVKAGQWRKVSVVIGYADKGNILFSVKVDNSILQDNKFVVDGTENLGEELLEDPNAPALTWPGHDMTQPFTLTDAMFDAEGNCIEPFAFDLSSPNGIESLQVTVGSTNSQFLASMSAIQLPQTFDLCALDASSAAGIILKGFGYPVGSELKGQTAKSFNIAGQIRALYEFDGTHTFAFTMTDAKGVSSEAVLTLVVDKSSGQTGPRITWRGYDIDQQYEVQKDMVIDIDIEADKGIKSFFVTIDSETLRPLLPVINLPEKFDICDIPDELVEVLHGEFGFPINEQVKNRTSVTFSITKFVEILLEIPGEHNFVLDVTDNDNVLTHKTVKLIVH